jgi:hypothetical protein
VTISPTLVASVRSAAVSYLWGLWSSELSVLGAGYVDGALASPSSTLSYLLSHWWAGFIVATIPAAYRARQGYVSATSVVSTPTYTSVPVPPPTSVKGP